LLLAACAVSLRADKLSFDERMELERGLTADFATSKIILPHSKKPLIIHSDGSYDKADWDETLRENGPTARLGDQIQITRIEIEGKRIVLEINGGTKSGHWYDHLQVGVGGMGSPTDQTPGPAGKNGQAANGSHIALVFPSSVPSVKADDVRRMLAPIFDFDKHSATELYVDRLPEPVKQAIKQQHAIAGMDKDQVLLAMGKPQHKSRETNDLGDEIEDWVYGQPPGKVIFVRFNEGKVVKVQDSYANIGGSTVPDLPASH
jgi:hypothetical protein